MDKEGYVSVWVGRGEDRDAFDKLMEYKISDDDGLGEFESCTFCKKYGIQSYDPDNFGGRYFPKKIKFKLLFHETTFASKVTADCVNVEPSNCYVLLYDYEYNGDQKDIEIEHFYFSFIGVYKY